MKIPNEFEWTDGDTRNHPEGCSAWADALSDAADGLLTGVEQEALDRHVRTCPGCAWELADAQRGAAWLAMLKGHAPEPPADLLSSILQKTSGTEQLAVPASPALAGEPLPAMNYGVTSAPVWAAAPWVSVEPRGLARLSRRIEGWLGLSDGFVSPLQPRLAMTSAMAFFSICLTLNLLGISVRNLSAESLRPAGLQRTVADKSASLVRSFEGIRIVYRVESRVNEWRTASAAQAAPLETNR